MSQYDRRHFLQHVGLGLTMAGAGELLAPASLVRAQAQQPNVPLGTLKIPRDFFASGTVIGNNNRDTLILTSRSGVSQPLVIANTRVFKGQNASVTDVKVGDYVYCVTSRQPDGKLHAGSVWVNHVFPPAEITARNGSSLRVRFGGDPHREGEVRLTPQTEIWGKGRSTDTLLVAGSHIRVLGTVIGPSVVAASKIYIGSLPVA